MGIESPKKSILCPKTDTVAAKRPASKLSAAPESTSVNNNHTCDELTCGGNGLTGCGISEKDDGFSLFSNQSNGCQTNSPYFCAGWMSVGAFINTHWPENRNNAPLLYNDRNAEAGMNQLYLSFGRYINAKRNKIDFGGQIDILYGTDYFFTSSLGLETRRTDFLSGAATLDPQKALLHWNPNDGLRRNGTAGLYGLSLPQFYGEIFMPIASGMTVRAGHFYSDAGLESAMSPKNFFYSHSYSFMYGGPVTLTGAEATIKITPRLAILGGISSGWNTFDRPDSKFTAHTGFAWESHNKKSTANFVVQTGEESLRSHDNRTHYTLTLQQKLTRKLTYSFEHTFGYEENGAQQSWNGATSEWKIARWISVAQYLQWKMNEKWSIGLRGEWFQDQGLSRIQQVAAETPNYSISGTNYYELTLGVNWKPVSCVTIRPEVRYDWSDVRVRDKISGVESGIYSNRSQSKMVSFAIDGIVRF
ncbi:MAG: outer membrane beta-barrel protein [Thermoguttaceae bacterium]